MTGLTGGATMIDRRTILAAAMAAIASPVGTRRALAQAAMSHITAYAFSFPALAGGDIKLAGYAGRPLMIVNTASLCGFTPQYAGLQQLWSEFHDRGLMIVGVPPTISVARSRAARPTSPRPRIINMASPSRSPPTPS
jgi:hypothetical protein